MAKKERKFKHEAWILNKQNLNKLWDELDRISNGDYGYIRCEYKDGGTNDYTNPCELASHEENRDSNEVIKVFLIRSNSKEGSSARLRFSRSSLLSSPIYIMVEKRHGDARINLINIENVLLSTRPHWWWIERVKLWLACFGLVWGILAILFLYIVLINVFLNEENWTETEIEMWPLVPFLCWIVLVLVSFLFRFLMPTGTLEIGEGIRRAENMKAVRKNIFLSVSIIGSTAALIITALKIFGVI